MQIWRVNIETVVCGAVQTFAPISSSIFLKSSGSRRLPPPVANLCHTIRKPNLQKPHRITAAFTGMGWSMVKE